MKNFLEIITIKKLDSINLLDSELMDKEFYQGSALEV